MCTHTILQGPAKVTEFRLLLSGPGGVQNWNKTPHIAPKSFKAVQTRASQVVFPAKVSAGLVHIIIELGVY